MIFYALAAIGGFLSVFGGILFIIDSFRVHLLWGLSAILFPVANVVCLIQHWAETRRGFLLGLLGMAFLTGAFFMMPKAGSKDATGQPVKINDPFYNVMQRAREAAVMVKNSRKEEAPVSTPSPAESTATPIVNNPPAATPMRVFTLPQRLAGNRASFKKLESDFSALAAKRKALPKNDSKAIAAFNLDAKAYADNLAEARSEQAILLELERTSHK